MNRSRCPPRLNLNWEFDFSSSRGALYHLLRSWHRWVGIVVALFLASIAVTGFLLATKGTFGWIRPPEAKGSQVEMASDIVAMGVVVNAAFSVGISDLKTLSDIDRIDYRPKSNIFKVVSKRGYHEVQVDGKTGRVLQVAKRNDQLAEDIHDLSFFHDLLKDWWLPVVAIALLAMSVTGVAVFVVPYVRRAKFRKKAIKGGDAP